MLEDHRWELKALHGSPLLPGAPCWIDLRDGHVDGHTGINRNWGTYRVNGDRITMAASASEDLGAWGGLGPQEHEYLIATDEPARFRLEDGRLVMWDADGREVFAFEAAVTVTVRVEGFELSLGGLVAVELFARAADGSPDDVLGRVVTRHDPDEWSRQRAARKAQRGSLARVAYPLAVNYRPSEIEPARRYSVRARVEDGPAAAVYEVTAGSDVITANCPRHVDLMVRG